MNTRISLAYSLIAVLTMSVLLSSCLHEEDPGPRQEMERDYAILDFDRLEMGDAFVISVQQSPLFSVSVRGDRRNIDDLEVEKVGSTLRIRYDEPEYRQYTTYITITMPSLRGANFSGASVSTVTGFNDLGELDVTLSGASVSQVSLEAQSLRLNLSGASKLTLSGEAAALQATVSGASIYSGFAFGVDDANVDVSGASKMHLTARQKLNAVATGASTVLYRGSPSVTSQVSGASSVQAD